MADNTVEGLMALVDNYAKRKVLAAIDFYKPDFAQQHAALLAAYAKLRTALESLAPSTPAAPAAPTGDGAKPLRWLTEEERAFDQARVNGASISMDFTDSDGVRGLVEVEPRNLIFSYTEEYPEAQWMLVAYDFAAKRVREFPLRDIHRYNGNKTALVALPLPGAAR